MNADEPTSEVDLRHYLRVLRRRKSTVLAAVVLTVAAALAASLAQKRVYQGTAEVLLRPRTTESLFDPTTGQRLDPDRNVKTEIRVLESRPITDAVKAKLGSAPHISVDAVADTDVIDVHAFSRQPKRAADVANAYANAYIDYRRNAAIDDIAAAGREIQRRIDDMQKQIDDISGRISSAAPTDRPVVEQNLGPRRDSLVQQQALFKQRLDQLQVDAALKSGGAQLVTPATVPRSPVKPTPKRNAILALVAGLMLGVGLAFLIERLDESIKTKDDVDRVAPGVPVLALVPALPSWKNKSTPQLVSRVDPKSSMAEAYRSLRTSVQFMAVDRPLRALQVTSPSATEGKTTTVANLAVALAATGQRVVVVCCDLRRPRVHDFFGLTNKVGFTSVLLGEASLAEAVQPVPDESRLMLLASGPLPPNPSELLASPRTAAVLTSLRADADIVLLDSPPVLPVTDAAVLSARVDGTLLVATAGMTTRKELARAIELLRQVDARLIGTVLNGVTAESGYGYAYYNYRYEEAGNGQRRSRVPQ